MAKEGASDSALVWADVIEDGGEKAVDDIETNKFSATAGEPGDEAGAEYPDN